MKRKALHKEQLLKKISDYLKKKSKYNLIIGFIKALGIIIILFFLLTIIELNSFLSPFSKQIILLSILSAFFLSLFIFIKNPINKFFRRKVFSEIELGAKEIGESLPRVKDNLINSLQIIKAKTPYSKELSNAAFEKTYEEVKGYNFLNLIDQSSFKKKLFYFFLLASVFVILIVFTPLNNAFTRVINFNTEYIKPSDFSLKILTKNKKIKKGEFLTLEVLAKGKIPNNILINTKGTDEAEFIKHLVKPDSNNIFSLIVKNLNHSFEYFASKDDIKTKSFFVEITSPPIINSINFEIIPPKYSGLLKQIQIDNGNISTLKGSRVNYNFTSSKQLTSAKRVSESNIDSLLVDNKKVNGAFTIWENGKYHFEIIDVEGNINENPILYSIIVIQDQFPEVEITRPEQVSLVPNTDIVSINYNFRDDYGFSKIQLNYSISSSELPDTNQVYKRIDLHFNSKNIKQTNYFNWDVSKLGLRENENVSYFIEVFDNDYVSGPKSSKSKIHKLRVPTLNELFTQADETQENAIEELTTTLEEAEELKNEFQKISDELKQNEKKINWSEKERIEDSMKKFEKLTDKIDNVQKKLDEMKKQMAENDLLSEKTIEKYNELQDLMNELSNDEMKKAFENMQKSLEQLMRDKVQKSLDNLSFNEKMFQKSIERTLNLLKKIQIEQKVDELIKRTEKLNEDMKRISEKTEKNTKNNNSSENNELSKEQDKVSDQLKSLNEEMKKLQKKMGEVKDMPIEKMNEVNENFSEQENQELSEEAKEKLQENNPFDALKSQQKISKNMNSMLDQMKEIQQQMQQQSQQMVMQNMLKAIDNIIDISKQQEKLNLETKALNSNPRSLPEMAEAQMDIQQSLDKILKQLSDLSQNTFAITPEMGEALGKARENMKNAVDGLQGRNGQKSNANQSNSMKNLNEAATLMQNSLMAMMQGGGQGSGMMSLMQQLQQMAQQQMGLNKMTQMIQQGQLSMKQQAQLQRLAQQQGALQKSLEELNKEAREAGNSKKLSTNLEKILEEMKEVVSGLNTKKVDDDLINKQEKILSKLLDAQQSINEKDFEKNRESFSGKNFNLTSPDELIISNEKGKDILREELIKSIQEGYSKDYQELIKRYFESLEKMKN